MDGLRGAPARREFERFVADHTADLLRTAYLITWSGPEAEDLLQEAWLITAQRWPTIHAMEHPLAYVRRTLVNLALRTSRGARAEASSVDPDVLAQHEDQRLEGNLAMIDTRSEITWLLGVLPRNQRAVIVLRYFDQLSEAEIAEELGWPVGTVKSTSARAIERLRRRAGADASATASPTPTDHRLTC